MRRCPRLLLLVSLAGAAVACRDSTSPGASLSIASEQAIASGDQFTCVLSAQGAATCWGANDKGQLGNGTTTNSAPPAMVTGGHRFTQIAATLSTTCAVDVDGAVWCWGFNGGRLGNGDTTASAVPVKVQSDQHFSEVAGGVAFCGLTTAGAVYCWGTDINGQLGNGTVSSTPSLVPVAVTGAPAFTKITGALYATCGITASGAAYCWGADVEAQLGVAAAGVSVPTPTPVLGGLSFADMKLGATVSCGVAAGTTYCWGTNFFGSLGQGATTGVPPAYQPTPIAAPRAFTRVYPGSGNAIVTPTCALQTDGAAYCWGASNYGQLGTTATPSTCTINTQSFGCSGDPLPVSGSFSFKVLSVAAEHVCGITTSQQVVCWGRNDFNQSGGGPSATPITAPVVVPGVSGA